MRIETRGRKPLPIGDRTKSFTVTLHPEFIRLFDLLPGSNGQKIERAFGFDRLNPGRGLVPVNVQAVTISETEDRSGIETLLAIHG